MDFDLSEEQQLLKDSVSRWLTKAYDFERRRTIIAGDTGWSRDVWSEMASLGLTALPFSEDDGGMGGGPVETMLVMEQLGRALVIEPYAATVLHAGGAIRHGADEAHRADLAARIAEGSLTIALADAEPHQRWTHADIRTVARRIEGGWSLTGAKTLVVHGAGVDHILIPARIDTGDIGLFLIEPSSHGLTFAEYPAQDGTRAADLSLTDLRVTEAALIGDPAVGAAALERAIDETHAALMAEAVGAMDEALAMTVDYLKTRKQFGVAIGTFQSLQHRAAEMFVALEQARSMAYFATMSAREPDAPARRRAMLAAKVQISRAARFIGQQSVQLHGGIGVTMEYKVGSLFKRLAMIEKRYGDADFCLDLLAAGDAALA